MRMNLNEDSDRNGQFEINESAQCWRANKDVAWQEDGLLSLNYQQAVLNFWRLQMFITRLDGQNYH